jgi:hypothetical protein
LANCRTITRISITLLLLLVIPLAYFFIPTPWHLVVILFAIVCISTGLFAR